MVHRRRLVLVLAITSGVVVVQVLGGIVTGSLALLADAGHMFTDVAGISACADRGVFRRTSRDT